MRWRWMYYMTGLPGWMRFGFSPGWIGRSPTGLGPCATLLLTGRWPTPQMQAWWRGMRRGDELQFLKEQARLLQEELETINRRIREIEGEGSS